MDLEKCLQVFELTDISLESKETLKKKYRKLMLKYHPDVCGDDNKAKDISNAYEILLETVDKIETYKALNKVHEVRVIILPLSSLIKIYNNERVEIDGKEITHGEIKKNNTLVIVDVNLIHNGVQHNFTNIQPWDINDNYIVNCDINVNTLDNVEEIIINVRDKFKVFRITAQSIKIVFRLEFGINVSVVINKKIVE